MMILLYILIFFVVALSQDWLGVFYHRSREDGDATMATLWGFLQNFALWLPMIFAIDQSSPLSTWGIALADILGGTTGVWMAIRRIAGQQYKRER